MNLLIIDNYEVFREGLVKLMQSASNLNVACAYGTLSEVVKAATEHKPDIVLMDTQSFESMDVISRIQQVAPKARIIVLTHSKASADVFFAMSVGASGYILKDIKYESLFKVLTLVTEGKLVIDESIARLVFDAFKFIHNHMHIRIEPEQLSSLTYQEKVILALLAKDASNKEIASSLCVTDNTVKGHMRNIMRKLHARNRLEAVLYAVEAGLAYGMYETQGKDSTCNSD